MNLRFLSLVMLFALLVVPSLALAQETTTETADSSAESKQESKEDPNAGQDKLDEATEAKIGARTPRALQKVIDLCEEAMEIGLDEANAAVAKRLLAASAFQRAELMVRQLPRMVNNPNALRTLRKTTQGDLKKAIENNPEYAEAYVMLARLETLPGGDREQALEYLEKGIELLEDEVEKSKAFILRAAMRGEGENEERLEDLAKAIELDPANTEAWQARIALQLAMRKFEDTFKDAEELLSRDEDNPLALEAAIQALLNLEKTDKVVEMMTKRIEKQPDNAIYYRVRAQAHVIAEDSKEALADLDKAIEINSRDYESLILRGQVYFDDGEIEKANRDISDALLIEPNSVQGIVMRSLVAAREDRYGDAIADMELLVSNNPSNPGWVMQLASYYQMDDRPRRAISLLSELLIRMPKNWKAMRLRGDARLAISDHKEAVKDYEEAIDILVETEGSASTDPDYSGALNNLAWVLATSPQDDVRNGEKAVEYGSKACELTEYNAAHILSTLAAGYAEMGDFESARKWSAKAVEVGAAETPPNPQLEQLKEELDNYKKDKPWREGQDIKENEKRLSSASETIDT